MINAALDTLLEDELAYRKVTDKLSIGVTEFPMTHVRYCKFDSNEAIRCLAHASMYLPLYCEASAAVQGRWVIDGGFSFSGQHLSHGNDTLFVGIDENAEVSGQMSLWEMAYPMVEDRYEAAVKMGYNALMAWNGTMKDKIANRRRNWGGVTMWPLVLVSMAYNCLVTAIEVMMRLLMCVATVEFQDSDVIISTMSKVHR